jgi:crossover junction endodeoxyribonuclease RuvC
MIYIGIDPGMSGSVVAIRDRKISFVRNDQTEADVSDFIEGLGWDDDDSFAVIERVHSMPKQGVASSFKFGVSYGFLRGCLFADKIAFEEVTPQKWQKEMGCLTHGNKNVSKARAQQLFPGVKITHANADALLIAEYCRRLCVSRRG